MITNFYDEYIQMYRSDRVQNMSKINEVLNYCVGLEADSTGHIRMYTASGLTTPVPNNIIPKVSEMVLVGPSG